MAPVHHVGVDRRWWALTGLVAVLLAAVVVPVAVRTYPGTPVAAPPPGPPSINECLQQPVPASDTGVPYSFPDTFGPCGPLRDGEIIAMVDDVDEATAAATTAVDEALPCLRQQRAYLGLTSRGTLTGVAAPWTPTAVTGIGLVPPTDRQRLAGQHWGACVVFVWSDDGSTSIQRYAGSLRGAYAGHPSAALARCSKPDIQVLTAAGQGTLVPCRQVHGSELLAVVPTLDARLTEKQIDSECQVIARAYLGRADPTVGGQLVATVISGYVDEFGTWVSGFTHQANGGAECVVTPTDPDHQLSGTLFGLGDGVIPWS